MAMWLATSSSVDLIKAARFLVRTALTSALGVGNAKDFFLFLDDTVGSMDGRALDIRDQPS
jgi:hypothetical protein